MLFELLCALESSAALLLRRLFFTNRCNRFFISVLLLGDNFGSRESFFLHSCPADLALAPRKGIRGGRTLVLPGYGEYGTTRNSTGKGEGAGLEFCYSLCLLILSCS